MEQSFKDPVLSNRDQLQAAILNSLDVNVAVLDKEGFIVEVNDCWTQFAQENGGDKAATGVGVNYFEVCRRSKSSSFDAERVASGIRSVMNGAAPKFTHEYWCNSPVELRWFVMTAVRHPSVPGGAVILHQKTSQIRDTELRYGQLLDSVRAIVWRAEAPDFRTTFASKQIENILGFSVEDWTKDPLFWEKRLHPDDREWVLRYRSQEVAARRQHTYDYRILDAVGKTIWLRNRVSVIVETDEVKELVGVSTDVTERMEAIAERDRLAIRLLRSQEEERSAIARELHDDVGQSVAILGVKLQLLKGRFHAESEEAAQLEEAHQSINRLAQDVQRISHGLHSSSLELLGLASAAANHCREYALHSEADVRCDIGDVPRDLDRDVAVCMFRVLQECLRNVAKHSQARHVMVRLSQESSRIQLEISDDGVGFDPEAEIAGPGLGLASMSERVRLLHGELAIVSSVGNGTQVTAVVPYRKNTSVQRESGQR